MNQQTRLKSYLEEFKEIDPLTAWKELGIYRLAAVVHELRGKGVNIETRRRSVFNKFGEGCVVANYEYYG